MFMNNKKKLAIIIIMLIVSISIIIGRNNKEGDQPDTTNTESDLTIFKKTLSEQYSHRCLDSIKREDLYGIWSARPTHGAQTALTLDSTMMFELKGLSEQANIYSGIWSFDKSGSILELEIKNFDELILNNLSRLYGSKEFPWFYNYAYDDEKLEIQFLIGYFGVDNGTCDKERIFVNIFTQWVYKGDFLL